MERNAVDPERMCPGCGSTRQSLIFYGMPEFTNELLSRLEAGSVVLGGCCITGEDPEWRCRDCRREWGVSRQSRELYELARSARSGEPRSLWVRLLSWIFVALLFVPVKALFLIWFKIVPAIHRAKAHCQQLVRRRST